MSWYRKNPLFAIGLTLCALLTLGELGLIYERWSASREAAKRLAQRKADLMGMSALVPPPKREVASAIEADLAKALKALESMQGELKGRGPAAERLRGSKVPGARTDAYFDLATYVEKMRDIARKQEIEVRPDAARFGFAAYANEGPLQDHIEPVFRQRLVAQYLVEALLEARPRAILGIKREHTVTKAEREARAAALANGEVPAEAVPSDVSTDSPDYFAIDPRVTARSAGYIDTMAFRFIFTGQTAALRVFLNKLASFELPVLVREVEVDIATPEETVALPQGEEAAGAADTPAAAGLSSVVLTAEAPAGAAAVAAKTATPARPPRGPVAAPIVTKPLSKYTVTVEFIELVPPPAPAGDAAAAPPPNP